MKKLSLVLLLVLAACGKEGDTGIASCAVSAPPCTSTAPAYNGQPSVTNANGTTTTYYNPRYPYFYTMMCNGKLTSVTVTGPSMEPVQCPAN
jgi:hypothetical protein